MALLIFFRPAAMARSSARGFHSTPQTFVRFGQKLPSYDGLFENSPGYRVNLADELATADGYIIGVPGAFTGTCSSKHIPSFINHPKLKRAGKVFVVSVNDPFVMKAWGEQLDPSGETGIRFLADPSAGFTQALDLDFDGTAIFGGIRSKRYALKIQGSKVAKFFVEPDATGADVSMADKVFELL